jgi:hypothetical protein
MNADMGKQGSLDQTVEVMGFVTPNDTVHRAAANDVDFRTRAARGSGATDGYATAFPPPQMVN